MPIANWGMANTPQRGFQNALAMGMQMGAQARQAQDAREERNALAAFAKDPSEQNFAGLADVRPDIAIQQRQQMQAQQAKAKEAELVQRAIGGDAEAMDQLAPVNFDKWKTLNADQKAAIERETKAFANAALDVLNDPPEERTQAILGYAQRFGSQEIAQIAQLPPEQQEAALRAAVAEGQMIERLIRMEQPDYQPLGADQVFVDVRNPEAVQQFVPGGQRGAPQAPPTSGGGRQVSYDQYRAILNDAGQSAADAFIRDSGAEIQVQTREQVDMLPSGAVFITPDGRRKVKP